MQPFPQSDPTPRSTSPLALGVQAIRQRPGLAWLMYGLNLLIALLISIPLLIVMQSAVSGSGWSEELATNFDPALWADIFERSPDLLITLLAQLFWVVPVYLVWNVLSLTGLAHALSRGAQGSFWTGLGRYGTRAIWLGGLFLGMMIVGFMFVGLMALIANVLFQGAAGTWWVNLIFLPILTLVVFAVLDLAHDFARLELVFSERSVGSAWTAGFAWLWRSYAANAVYIVWMLAAVVTVLVATGLDFAMGGLVLAFLVQQVFMLARAAITVGWIGSEIAVWEAETRNNEPTIAEFSG